MDLYWKFKEIADRGLENQEIHENDTYNEEGLLKCGTCGELRQEYIEADGGAPLLIVKECKCDRFKRAREEKEQREKKNEERRIELFERSGMPKSFKNASFDKWEISEYNKRNFRLCKSYADRFMAMTAKNQGLLFWGDTGTGKTWATGCIANEVIHQLHSVAFVSAIQIVEEDDRIQNASLLIIDDLGAERDTEYATEKVLKAIDDRYNLKKPMIITTNVSMKKINEETNVRYRRIYDRINEICYPMQFTGPSIRKTEGARRYAEMEKLLEE